MYKKHKWQNIMLLGASYVFYGAWNWKFLFLILLSTVIDYFCGINIYKNENIAKKKFFLALSIIANLSLLGFFKYYNFFTANLQELLSFFNLQVNIIVLKVVLPVGISFYTFQTMSYTIDIFRGKMKPANNFFDFALFVVYFPQLVAGPIERATRLLPQIMQPRKLNLEKIKQGFFLIFWGLFLKIFVADNLALLVDPVFYAEPPYAGIQVLLALYAFAFQIYCDFAGYSFVAIGLGSVMGITLMENFRRPYFSCNIAEFWRRWHIPFRHGSGTMCIFHWAAAASLFRAVVLIY